MPVMRRSEIIEKYGFDPLKQDESGGASVVEQGKDTQPITVGDPKAPDLQETGSAGVVDNLQAGAVKSVLSDPLMLFGLAVGATDYALGKLGVTQDGTFEEQLFVDGGAEQVKNHIQEYADKVKAEHPDWKREQVLGEVDRYRLTEDFFNFTTDRMKPGLSKGLKNALWVNKETGVNKLPTQETTTDSVMQALGGLALPMPPIADFAARALGRVGNSAAARAAIHVADALVTPGTQASHYGALPVAAGTAVNLGIDQVQRTAQGDPNLLREDAFWDFSKMHAQLPREAEMTVPPGGSTPPQPLPTGDRIADAWNINDAALAGGAGAAIAAAALGGRSLVRRFRPNVPTPGVLEREGPNVRLTPNPPDIREQSLDNLQRRGLDVPERERVVEGMVQDLLPEEIAGTPIAERVRVPTYDEMSDAIGSGVDQDSAIKQVANEVGGREIERDVDAIVGTYMSPASRASGTNRFFESGVLPDGSRTSVLPKDFINEAQALPETDVADFVRGNLARNELDARDDVLNYSSGRYIEAYQARQAYTGTDPARLRALDDTLNAERARMQEHVNDTGNTRHAYRDLSSDDLRNMVAAQEANPRAMQLEQTLRRLNTDLVNFERRAGIITPEVANTRLQRPWHSSIFQVQKRGFLSRFADTVPDSNMSRSTEYEFDPPGSPTQRVAVEKSIDAFSSFGARAAASVDRAQYVIGARRALNMLTNADPNGRFVRYRGAQSALTNPPPPERSIVLPRDGVDHVWEVSSPSFARAFKQMPIDLGMSLGIANRIRKFRQYYLTGPLTPGAIGTAFRSLGFDMSMATVARPEGRSFGLVGSTLRRYTGATDPNSTMSRVIDKVEALTDANYISPGVQVLAALATMPIWKVWGKTGQALMDAAITQNGVLGRIARLPGGQTFLRNVGSQMMQRFESTPLALMTRHNAFNAHAQLVDSFNTRTRIDQIIDKWAHAGRNETPVMHTARMLKDAWISGLDNIHNAAKYAFFSQNYAALEARYGRGRIPPNEVRRLANEAKNLAGNMQALPGNKVVAGIGATVPYANMMMQSTKYLVNATFHQGLNQSTNVMLRMAGVVGTAWAGLQMMEEMGVTDWMYEKMPDWDRIGHVFIPTAENIIHKAQTGSYIKPDIANGEDPRKYFYRIKLAPEVASITQAFLGGMEALGLVNRGRNMSHSSATNDQAKAIASHIGSAEIPGISLLFAMTGAGQSVDFMRSAEGRSVVQSTPVLKGLGINSDRTPGGIPTFATELATTIFGTTGSMLSTALDAGMKENNAGGSAMASIEAGAKEIPNAVKQALPSVPGVWKADEKVYNTSPIGNRVYDTQAKMKEINYQYNIEFGNGGGREAANRIQDREVSKMVLIAHKIFEDGGYPKLEKKVNHYRQQIEDLTIGRGRTPTQVAEEKRKLLLKMQSTQEQMLNVREKFESKLGERFGERFDREKVPPTLDGIIELAKKYSQVSSRVKP